MHWSRWHRSPTRLRSAKDEIESETGLRPAWAFENFTDPYENVRQSIRRLQVNPFIAHKEHIRGFVYRVDDGYLEETVP